MLDNKIEAADSLIIKTFPLSGRRDSETLSFIEAGFKDIKIKTLQITFESDSLSYTRAQQQANEPIHAMLAKYILTR